MPPVYVASEIGPLRAVLVHAPGNEILAVTPGTRENYLYPDIIDLETAGAEHHTMVEVLQRFADVHEVRDLLLDIARSGEARNLWITRTADIVHSDVLARQLARTTVDDLVATLIEGRVATEGPIAGAVNKLGFALPPLPNLLFTRDAGIVIGGQVLIGSMRHGVRWTEELLIKALFLYHNALQNDGMLYDGSEERRLDYTLEGGDVHPLREDLLVLGLSDRSSAPALDELCERVFAHGSVTDVIVVVMPGEPAAIHLDMIFAQVDRDLCVVSPRHFIGPERVAVLHRRKGSHAVKEMADFFAALEAVGHPLEAIRCGGSQRPAQEREQWASGCNVLTLRPGVGLAYRRNDHTLREFERAGFEIVDAQVFLAEPPTDPETRRRIITIPGSELVRGGGGPRCMTLPLRREAA